MLTFLATALALGIAGFDPLGSIVLLAGLGRGLRRPGVIALGVTSVGTSLVLALLGALGLGPTLHTLLDRLPRVPHGVWVVVVLLGGLALLGWAAWRLTRHRGIDLDGEDSRLARSTSTGAMVVAGLLVGLSSLVDGAFWAMLLVAGGLDHVALVVAEALIWVLCSHSLLIVLVTADLVGGHERVNSFVTTIQQTHAKAVNLTIVTFLALWGVLLVADAVGAWVSGTWFLEV